MGTAGTVAASSQRAGRPIKYYRWEVVNAIRYVLRTGCAWRMLPHGPAPRGASNSTTFAHGVEMGTLERIHEGLRDRLRTAEGRAASSSGAIIDSQLVKTTEKGGLVAMMLVRR